MPFQKISGNFVELSVDNYLGSIKSGSSISDLGFQTYRESVVGVMPVSGTGGNPGISLALNTTNPLSSDADLRLVKDSVNRQGEGFSVDFSIQNRHQSKVLQISFDTELISGIYTNQDLIPKTGTFTVASTTCTVTASHSLVVGQAVNMNFPGGTAPASGLYVITAIVPGVSFSFTISSGSGSGVSCTWNIISSLRVYIIANPTTNPTVIEPVNTGLQLGIANQKVKHIASFQTNNSGNSYRMVIHITKPGILPYTVDFANFKIWEPTQSIGAIITDWVSYVPSFAGWTLASGGSMWRRVGDSIEIFGSGKVASISGNPPTISLPNGLSLDTENVVSRVTVFGTFQDMRIGSTHASFNPNSGVIGYDSGIGAGVVRIFVQQSASLYSLDNASIWIGANDSINWHFKVPIAGWGSTVAMSSDTGDGRVVACRIQDMVSGTTTSNGFAWSTTSYDTHSMVRTSGSGATQRTEVVIPVSGYYRVSASVVFNNSSSVEIYKNGTTSIAYMTYTKTSNIMESCSTSVYLLAGDYIYIRSSGTHTSQAGTGAALTVERITAGTQQIAATETVACSYYSASNQTTLTTQINFGARNYDTHNAVTTGASWKFTAPMSGKYAVVGKIQGSAALGGHLFKNNTKVIHLIYYMQSTGVTSFSTTIDLISGDFIDLRPSSSATVSGGIISSADNSYIDIFRIGI